MADLSRAFERLNGDAQPREGTFAALPLGRNGGHLAALDERRSPCLLLRALDRRASPIPALRLQGLEIQYDVRCHVEVNGAPPIEEILTTVVCTSANRLEQSYFIHAAEIVLRAVGSKPTISEIEKATRNLASIFQKLSRPARQTVTGIIGELLLIKRARSASVAVHSWRISEGERFDFVQGRVRLEAKATERRERSHHLTYEQCQPPLGAIGILMSVAVESVGNGTSLAELIESIEERLTGNSDAVLHLHEVVADTLGRVLPQALSERFDEALAESSIRFFDLKSIPAIRGSLPAFVSEVRFKSNLTTQVPLDLVTLDLDRLEMDLLPGAD
jgi:hypothetical protein